MAQLVEIEYRPYRKIVVHEVKKLEPSVFFPWLVAQVEAQKAGGTPAVNWTKGVAFVTSEFLPSPQTVEENLKGVAHYAAVTYTETSYEAEKRINIGGRGAVVRLNNVDDNPNFAELVKFLKSFGPSTADSLESGPERNK